MRFYFSGVSGSAEYEFLAKAGVDQILVDPKDLSNIGDDYAGSVAIDSGAYRAWKAGTPLEPPFTDYFRLIDETPFDFAVMADVVGDHEETRRRWVKHFKPHAQDLGFIPVWGWLIDHDHLRVLDHYLDESRIVAIGGLVPLMRDHDKQMLEYLIMLCRKFPRRFHILGCNWLKAIEELRPYAYSCDSSKFLDAARYGHVIFKHTKNGHLQQAPSKVLGFGHWSREERCVARAIAIKAFCEEEI